MNVDEFLARLNAENDEEAVRKRLAGGKYNAHHEKVAQFWLDHRAKAVNLEATARAEEREKENLSVSRAALQISDRANKISIWAIVFSVVIAIIVGLLEFFR